MCAQRRLRSALASTQSDQRLLCPPEESLRIKRTSNTLIRLGGRLRWAHPTHLSRLVTKPVWVRPAKTQISLGIRPAWSESSLSAWRKLGSLSTCWAHGEDWSLGGCPGRSESSLGAQPHCFGFVKRRLIFLLKKMLTVLTIYLYDVPDSSDDDDDGDDSSSSDNDDDNEQLTSKQPHEKKAPSGVRFDIF